MSDPNNLLEALVKGDSRGILKIYDLVFPAVLKFIFQNKGAREDAEDIFQRALMQIAAQVKVKGPENIENFQRYLYGVCKNLWRKELNSRKNWVINPSDQELSSESEVQKDAIAVLENERWELYRRGFDQLSENCRQILTLFLKKKKYKEIAEELGYNSELVVSQRVFKCKDKLSKLIKKDPSFKNLKNYD